MGTIVDKEGKVRIEETSEEIPLERLGEDNPIEWASMLHLYEDELGDNGSTSLEFRFRTMGDCWFGLLRNYVRIDDVIVRIYDTRLFHDYSTNYVIRQFTVFYISYFIKAKEESYDELRKKGFNFTP
jgi:type 2A phosphatase activator TIP41